MAQRLIAINPEVMQDKRLELLDKLILSYVKDWEFKNACCFAKDGMFAYLFGVQDNEVFFSLIKLEALGLIEQVSGTGGRLIRTPKKQIIDTPDKDIFEL